MAFNLPKDIKSLLTSITTDVYLHDMRDKPDALITILLARGIDPVHTGGSQRAVWENPGFEIIVRHTSTTTALSWIESIKNALDGKTDTTINSHRYISIFQNGDVIPLGRDEKNRVMFSINFRCQVTR